MSKSLEHPDFVQEKLAQWKGVLPKSMEVVEFCGTGDPFFGGSADDRPLGTNGTILDRGSNDQRAQFATVEEAHTAALAISNRRPKSILGILPNWH